MRPDGGRGKCAGGHGGHVARGDLQRRLDALRLLEHVAGIGMPVGFPCGHQVVEARVGGPLLQVADCMGRGVGQQVGARGCAPLVVDDGQPLALLCQPQHGLGEIAAAGPIDPARAQDEVPCAARLDPLLAFELGAAIDRQRRRHVVFRPGAGATAVEHVVGAVVHQPCTQAGGLLGQHAWRGRVEGAGQVRLAFGLVHSGVGRGIDDDVGPQGAHGAGDVVGPGEIPAVRGAVEIEGRDRAQDGQAALQFPADLPALAEKKDVHAVAASCTAGLRYWRSIHSR